jgi:PilZ domain
MSTNERRIAPRKACVVPLRFRVMTRGHRPNENAVSTHEMRAARASARIGTMEGESVNLSERGIYFKSRERVSIGEPLEMYLTIPRELTGRGAEDVRCRAFVVHVEAQRDTRGMRGVGAAVERFEPVSKVRN